MNYTLLDGLALGDILADAANPKPFRLFAVGDNHLTRNGNPFVLKLSAVEKSPILVAFFAYIG